MNKFASWFLLGMVLLTGCTEPLDDYNYRYLHQRESLRKSVEKRRMYNAFSLDEVYISSSEGFMQDLEMQQEMREAISEARGRMVELLGFLDQVIRELEEIGGFDPMTGELMQAPAVAEVKTYMLGENELADGGRGNGKAAVIRKRVQDYVLLVNRTIVDLGEGKRQADTVEMLAPDPGKTLLGQSRNMAGETWEYATFRTAGVAGALLEVERLKSELGLVEKQLIDFFYWYVTPNQYRMEGLVLEVLPQSLVVEEGQEFTCRITMGISVQDMIPEYSGDGSFEMMEDGSATMRLTAGVDEWDQNGLGEQRYQIRAKIMTADGSISEVRKAGSFLVRRKK